MLGDDTTVTDQLSAAFFVTGIVPSAAVVVAERTDDDDVDDNKLLFKNPLFNPNDDDADFLLDFVCVLFEDGWKSLRVVI